MRSTSTDALDDFRQRFALYRPSPLSDPISLTVPDRGHTPVTPSLSLGPPPSSWSSRPSVVTNTFNASLLEHMPSPPPAFSIYQQPSHQYHGISMFSSPFPLPSRFAHLTRSEALFAVLTGLHPHSLSMDKDHEHWLFVDMRARKQWSSLEMKGRAYVQAVAEYNIELEKVCQKKNTEYVAKHPRALIEKLASFESQVLSHIARDNYVG